MDGDQYHASGYFSETVEANGPWHAIFIFCGRHGFNPKDVRVYPEFRFGTEYIVSVGKMPSPYLVTQCLGATRRLLEIRQ